MATVFSPLHLVQRGIQDFVNISIEGKKIGVISIIWMECHLVIRVQLINVDLLPLWRNGKEKEERGDYEKETFASSQNLPQWSPDQWFQEWIYHTTKSHHDSTNSTSSHQGAETALVAHFSSVFFDTPMCFICDFASFLTLSCSFARRMVVNDRKKLLELLQQREVFQGLALNDSAKKLTKFEDKRLTLLWQDLRTKF